MILKFITSLTRTQKRVILLAVDAFALALAYVTAFQLTNSSSGFVPLSPEHVISLVIATSVGVWTAARMRLHQIKLNAYEMQGLLKTALVCLIFAISGATSLFLLSGELIVKSHVIAFMVALILSVGLRLTLRWVTILAYRHGENRKRILIYGAGQTGQQLAAALATDPEVQPYAFVDDNPTLQSLTIAGMRVYSPLRIRDTINQNQIERVVLAMPSTSQAVQARISANLRSLGCEVHSLPSFSHLVSRNSNSLETVPVNMSDLLGRGRLESKLPTVSDTYTGKNILITGAGGSIGSELCRQVIACNPTRVICLDHSEFALYTIDRELRELAPNVEIEMVLGSVCDQPLILEALTCFEVDVVLHAAAYKHVPLVEQNPVEGVRNNVFGTRCVAEAARIKGVEHFILVSSDKAVRPKSMMGASKRLSEIVVQDIASRSKSTLFSMVRFGNVLGSSGSVIPLFQEQISRGGPVTLTHSNVTRYFMTVSEAARLVLLAGSFARGGDVFVLDMGDPVPIKKLARQMVEGAGLSVKDKNNPTGDIEIKITGLRPGEKLHEELLIGSDMLTTPHSKILRAQEGFPSEIEVAKILHSLRAMVDARDATGLREAVSNAVEKQQSDAVNQ